MDKSSCCREPVARGLGGLAATVLWVAAVAGCSDQALRTAEVTGTVTYGGKPAVGVWVQFAPPDGLRRHLPSAIGVSDAAGRYRLVRPGNKPGAVVGTNRMTLSVMEGEGGTFTSVPAERLERASRDVEVQAGGAVHDIAL